MTEMTMVISSAFGHYRISTEPLEIIREIDGLFFIYFIVLFIIMILSTVAFGCHWLYIAL